MKKAIFTLVVSLLLVGCATRGSSAIDLGNGYIVATTAGSERWAIWGKIFEGQVGRSLIIWNKVSKIGVNKQYIIGLRERGLHPMHEEDGIKNPQPYGYFIIDKYTSKKTLGLTEKEARTIFTDLNISMSVLENTSRHYRWKNQNEKN